ncbi:MAG: phosphoribosylanthranilate isomerase [Acidimicrobiales bacterium]|nr:phosphoribosylanthranilate isomerase [Acidimicrobiales bacterium]
MRTAADHAADAVIIDGARPGSGQVFDWTLTEDAPVNLRLVVAGGLTPENVGAAISRISPWGVDVVSGVEASYGQKDPRRLRAFVAAARAAAPLEHQPSEDRPYDWETELLSGRDR